MTSSGRGKGKKPQACGLAAPQVFVAKRVVVYRIIAARIPGGSGLVPRPLTVMVNPVITPKTGRKPPGWERCLSIPGLLAREVHESPKGIDPLFVDLVERWPGRQRWSP